MVCSSSTCICGLLIPSAHFRSLDEYPLNHILDLPFKQQSYESEYFPPILLHVILGKNRLAMDAPF